MLEIGKAIFRPIYKDIWELVYQYTRYTQTQRIRPEECVGWACWALHRACWPYIVPLNTSDAGIKTEPSLLSAVLLFYQRYLSYRRIDTVHSGWRNANVQKF